MTKLAFLLLPLALVAGLVSGQNRLAASGGTPPRTRPAPQPAVEQPAPARARLSASPTSLYHMAYRFGDGIDYVVPEIAEVFSCEGRDYGYYADVANNCQIFHVCNPPEQQFSFFCPNRTLFDQRLLICQDEYVATPCSEAERWYVINSNFGVRGNPEINEESNVGISSNRLEQP